MSLPAKVDLGEHYSGDTWDGMGPVTVNSNGSPLDLTDAEIEMRFRRASAQAAILTLTSVLGEGGEAGDEDIEITDPEGGVFLVKPRILELEPELHWWDLKLTLGSGAVKTILAGQISIKENI